MGKIIRRTLDDEPVQLSEEELRRIDELAEKGGDTYYEDIPPMDDEFFANAKWVSFPVREQVSIELSPSTVDYFRQNGSDYQTQIREVVEAYVTEAQANVE